MESSVVLGRLGLDSIDAAIERSELLRDDGQHFVACLLAFLQWDEAALDPPAELRGQSLKLMLPVGHGIPDDVAELAGQMAERGHVRKDGYDGYHGEHSTRPLKMEQNGEAKRDPWQLCRRAIKHADCSRRHRCRGSRLASHAIAGAADCLAGPIRWRSSNVCSHRGRTELGPAGVRSAVGCGWGSRAGPLDYLLHAKPPRRVPRRHPLAPRRPDSTRAVAGPAPTPEPPPEDPRRWVAAAAPPRGAGPRR